MSKKKGFLQKSLDGIEIVGNRLPHPVTLFIILAGFVVIASAIASSMGVSVEDPIAGETLHVFNLLSKEGIQYMFESAVANFIGFAPLGTVLVTMLGIGLAERSGLISAALKALVTSVPRQFITAALVFGGVMSSMAADAGYVVLVPLGAVLFAGMGRHPLAGLAAAFAGVSGGFSANLLVTSLDPLLGGLTIQAASTIDPEYAAGMTYLMNWWFMIASVFLLTIVGTIITDKIIEPRLGKYTGDVKVDSSETGISAIEKKGLWASLISLLITSGLLALLVAPSWGPLRGEGSFIEAPFFQSLVPVLLIFFFVPGLVYGIVTKNIKNDKDVANQLSDTMASMGMYILLAFSAGQFVAYFNHTNLGKVLAVNGAEFLQNSGFTGIPLILSFLLVTAGLNMFIGSASAKWAIMAPVFVPIMMGMNYSPEFTQALYRVADSSTNVISPLLPYFAIVIAFAQKYDKKAGIGTIVSTMLPYSIAFFITWTIMIIVWMFTGLELGPGAPIYYGK